MIRYYSSMVRPPTNLQGHTQGDVVPLPHSSPQVLLGLPPDTCAHIPNEEDLGPKNVHFLQAALLICVCVYIYIHIYMYIYIYFMLIIYLYAFVYQFVCMGYKDR